MTVLRDLVSFVGLFGSLSIEGLSPGLLLLEVTSRFAKLPAGGSLKNPQV